MLLFWILIFIVSLAALVKGADWLLESAEKIGLALGLSPFIVGVLIVGAGTSFPELISSLAAMWQGASEIVAANVIGSNIANILLIVGVSAILAKRLVVTKSLIDLDLPLLAIGTVLILGVVWDRAVTFFEAVLLLVTYGFYLLYTVTHVDEETEELQEVLPSRHTRRKHVAEREKMALHRPRVTRDDVFLLFIGLVGLVVGAKYLIDSVIALSEILRIGTGVIAITAVAIGTSFPELLVSVKAAIHKKSEMALGNIFGSNVFNMFVVFGLPALFGTVALDEKTFSIGVPAMALATLLFVISGISRRVHIWEGVFYLAVYVLFVAKLFDLF